MERAGFVCFFVGGGYEILLYSLTKTSNVGIFFVRRSRRIKQNIHLGKIVDARDVKRMRHDDNKLNFTFI